MAVCVAGMHRSGTSMVARVLNLLGVDLGPEGEQPRPAPDNEAGFWEDPRFVALNDELLARLGGAWDQPPAAPDWDGERLDDLRGKARGLIASFRGRAPWGWKDPRNSLVLPFWRSLLPGLHVVVVVRNPLDVAASLHERNGFPFEQGLRLWRTYNEAVLATAPPHRRLVTPYEAYFTDFDREIRRAAAFLELEAGAERRDAALESVRGSLRHHRFDESAMRSEAGSEVLALFERLRVEADAPIPAEAAVGAWHPATSTGTEG